MYWDWALPRLQRTISATSVILFSFFFKYSLQIDCYVCSSFSANDPLCEDPFDPIFHDPPANPAALPGPHGGKNILANGSYIYLQRGCYGARKARVTAFPATACLKLAGHFSDTGESMVVRACALDGGSLTSDTEIVRQNHCGGFFLNERYVRGCLEACFTDGCNGSSRLGGAAANLFLLTLCLILTMVVAYISGDYLIRQAPLHGLII
ncbi:hypothetical protein BV898_00107 [Hypsibius exemplaris]|uniref:Protein sleepless n=1 Tax=Hypsibius exemplaris TaxID=2072580 RepID=A0A1W0XER3_HYPEX|nr:hypothetical protein BV898_00107 [Hypsibius exemplaris]